MTRKSIPFISVSISSNLIVSMLWREEREVEVEVGEREGEGGGGGGG